MKLNNFEFKIVKDIKENGINEQNIKKLVLFHILNNTCVSEKLSGYILKKSLDKLESDLEIKLHYNLLKVIDISILKALHPGIFSIYFELIKNGKDVDFCFSYILKLFKSIPLDTQYKIYKFFSRTRIFLNQTYQDCIQLFDSTYLIFFLKAYLLEEKILLRPEIFSKYILEEVENSIKLYDNNQKTELITGKHFILSESNNMFLDCLPKKLNSLKIYLHEELDSVLFLLIDVFDFEKNENILKYIYCVSSSHMLLKKHYDKQKHLNFLSDFIKNNILDLSKQCYKVIYENAILSNTTKMINNENFNIQKLPIFLLKDNESNILDNYSINPVETIKDLFQKLENKNNSSVSCTIASVIYLLENKFHHSITNYCENICNSLHTTDYSFNNVLIFLYLIMIMVRNCVLTRKQLYYIFKQLLYIDHENRSLRCYVLEVLRNILIDYYYLDQHINETKCNSEPDKILEENTMKTRVIISHYKEYSIENNFFINETQYKKSINEFNRIVEKDYNQISKKNIQVLINLLWDDIEEEKNIIEIYQSLKTLKTMINLTPKFLFRRLQSDSIIEKYGQYFLKDNEMFLDDKTYNLYFDILEIISKFLDPKKKTFQTMFDISLNLISKYKERCISVLNYLIKFDHFHFFLLYLENIKTKEDKEICDILKKIILSNDQVKFQVSPAL